ncbi:hypothetical protein CSOJ01_15198 [Colletotrichum sojae]|uniref:Secreted protein n=1 Tax=Colletotrichum sojae TaxID=2175907 RepID=A0A8H6INU0_9PEZI|nr:hypothetical protein CSOJ01_15198 [Colletotrichum sojae]
MKFLSTVVVLALSLSGVCGIPQINSRDEVAAEPEFVKRPNGPAPGSGGDPSHPPHGDGDPSIEVVKRPNGPAPGSGGDPTHPGKPHPPRAF